MNIDDQIKNVEAYLKLLQAQRDGKTIERQFMETSPRRDYWQAHELPTFAHSNDFRQFWRIKPELHRCWRALLPPDNSLSATAYNSHDEIRRIYGPSTEAIEFVEVMK